MGTHAKRYVLERVIGAIILFFIVFRFIHPSLVPFILDEPHLQLIIDNQFANHTLPLHGLDGSQGQAYGPLPLWIYMIIRLITDNPSIIAWYHNLFFTAGILIAFYWFRKHVDRRTDIFFLTFTLASPLLTFYGRLPWDNTFQVFFSSLLLWSTFSTHTKRHFWSGFFSGCLFSVHLMSVPLIVVAAVFKEFKIKPLLQRTLGFLIPTAVYLPGLIRGVFNGSERSKASWLHALEHLPRDAFHSFESLSTFTMKYFVADSHRAFFEFIPFDFFWVLLPLVLILLVIRYNRKNPSVIGKTPLHFLFYVCVSQWIYFFGLRLDASHPHYFMPILIPGLMLFFGWVARIGLPKNTSLRVVYVGLFGLVFLQMTAFQFYHRGFLIQNEGTQDLRVGPTVHAMNEFIQNLCLDSEQSHFQLSLEKVPNIFPRSLEYIFKHHQACTGKTLEWSNHGKPILIGPGTTGAKLGLIVQPSS